MNTRAPTSTTTHPTHHGMCGCHDHMTSMHKNQNILMTTSTSDQHLQQNNVSMQQTPSPTRTIALVPCWNVMGRPHTKKPPRNRVPRRPTDIWPGIEVLVFPDVAGQRSEIQQTLHRIVLGSRAFARIRLVVPLTPLLVRQVATEARRGWSWWVVGGAGVGMVLVSHKHHRLLWKDYMRKSDKRPGHHAPTFFSHKHHHTSALTNGKTRNH